MKWQLPWNFLHFTVASETELKKGDTPTPCRGEPDYKSLNCNHKSDGPSAIALLVFHCSFSGQQLVLLQISMTG